MRARPAAEAGFQSRSDREVWHRLAYLPNLRRIRHGGSRALQPFA